MVFVVSTVMVTFSLFCFVFFGFSFFLPAVCSPLNASGQRSQQGASRVNSAGYTCVKRARPTCSRKKERKTQKNTKQNNNVTITFESTKTINSQFLERSLFVENRRTSDGCGRAVQSPEQRYGLQEVRWHTLVIDCYALLWSDAPTEGRRYTALSRFNCRITEPCCLYQARCMLKYFFPESKLKADLQPLRRKRSRVDSNIDHITTLNMIMQTRHEYTEDRTGWLMSTFALLLSLLTGARCGFSSDPKAFQIRFLSPQKTSTVTHSVVLEWMENYLRGSWCPQESTRAVF